MSGIIGLKPIGYARSPIASAEFAPIQPVYAGGVEGTIELLPEYVPALDGLEGFSHIFVLYHFHMTQGERLKTKPYLLEREMGVFATRAPCRPNRIGLSVVRLLGIEGCRLRVAGIDMLDGTPVFDVKPYVGRFDRIEGTVDGWQAEIADEEARRIGMKGGPSREGLSK